MRCGIRNETQLKNLQTTFAMTTGDHKGSHTKVG